MRKSDKYRDEIADILAKAGQLSPVEPAHKRPRNMSGFGWLRKLTLVSSSSLSITPHRLMLVSFVLFITALIIHGFGATLDLVGPLTIAGIGVFIASYVLYFVKPTSGLGSEGRWRGFSTGNTRISRGYQKMWRGKVIDDDRSSHS